MFGGDSLLFEKYTVCVDTILCLLKSLVEHRPKGSLPQQSRNLKKLAKKLGIRRQGFPIYIYTSGCFPFIFFFWPS